jgi:urea transport system substrate-binding protein
MRRWLFGLIVLAIVGAVAAWAAPRLAGRLAPIRVGLLHSQTGPMKDSEKSMIDAEMLAIEEINARGGLLGGRLIEPVIADGRSDFPTFGLEAEKLIEQEKVSAIFGCWTSASRKSVKPVVERHHHLLFYPMAYEGLEESPNIVYTGAAPNQQVIPAVKWSYDRLKARKYFLAGSDYIWPHAVNAIVRDYISSLGAEVVGEEYVLYGSTNADALVDAIKRARPDVVISTVVGDTNPSFYRKLAEAGLGPREVPVIGFSIAEAELRHLPARDMVGDYAAWNYFQSIDSEPNRDFVRKFKARYGADSVTSDTIAAAYNSVLLWAQSVTEAETDEVAAVLKAVRKQSMSAPEGVISIDASTQHTWRPVFIGRIRGDGQFDIVWTSDKAVRPIPYPTSRSQAQWDAFVDELHRTWGGWANPGLAPGTVPTPGSAPTPPPVPRAQPAPPAAKPGSGRPAGPPPARKASQAPAPRRSGPDQGVASRSVPARPIGLPPRRDALR